jgi:hypothetical protein
MYIEYLAEFSNISKKNLSKDSLGGKDPKDFEWTLEIEPFSTFSY